MSFQRPGSRSKAAFGVSFRPQRWDDTSCRHAAHRQPMTPGCRVRYQGPQQHSAGHVGRCGCLTPVTRICMPHRPDAEPRAAAGSAGGAAARPPLALRGAPEEPPHKRARRDLPVARYRRQILYLLETHATVIIVGETGCGKTTQVGRHALPQGSRRHSRGSWARPGPGDTAPCMPALCCVAGLLHWAKHCMRRRAPTVAAVNRRRACARTRCGEG
jgi:hypothetical protein